VPILELAQWLPATSINCIAAHEKNAENKMLDSTPLQALSVVLPISSAAGSKSSRPSSILQPECVHRRPDH
jgi:hypothetical protein